MHPVGNGGNGEPLLPETVLPLALLSLGVEVAVRHMERADAVLVCTAAAAAGVLLEFVAGSVDFEAVETVALGGILLNLKLVADAVSLVADKVADKETVATVAFAASVAGTILLKDIRVTAQAAAHVKPVAVVREGVIFFEIAAGADYVHAVTRVSLIPFTQVVLFELIVVADNLDSITAACKYVVPFEPVAIAFHMDAVTHIPPALPADIVAEDLVVVAGDIDAIPPLR